MGKSKNNNEIPLMGIALRLFSEVSGWIGFPVVIAVIGGKRLDKYFGTAPVFILVFASIAFVVSCIGIIRTVKKYTAELKEHEEKEEKQEDKK